MVYCLFAAAAGSSPDGLLAGYVHDLLRLPQLWSEDPALFWMMTASIVVVLLGLLLIVTLLARQHSRREREVEEAEPTTQFVPVESSGADIDAVLLPLDQRISACQGTLSQDAARRIIQRGCKSLADIVTAYNRCDSGVQADLLRLVRQTKMMEQYSRCLDEETYPLGVLADAWACFPDPEVLRGFVELLAANEEKLQMRGVRLLSALKEPKTLSILMMAVVQPERYVPARVAEVFVSMPTQSASLLAYMMPELDDKYKLTVLEIIAQTKAAFPPENVLACLKHHNFHLRSAACLALGAGRIMTAAPDLLLAANDKRWQVRAAAARALGQLGDIRAVALLEALCQDKEGWVAAAAQEALAVFAEVRSAGDMEK